MSIISRISAAIAVIAFGLLALGVVSSTAPASPGSTAVVADEPWGKRTYVTDDEPWGKSTFSTDDEPWG